MKKKSFLLKQRKISKQILKSYIRTLLILAAGMFFIYMAARYYCRGRVWYPEDALYQQLKWLESHAVTIGLSVCFLGWGVITYFYIFRWMGYLDEVTHASQQLVNLSDAPIILSEEIKPIQDELNEVRQQALRSREAAREAEQRKNDLIIYLAHDLKTPLTSVIGYLTLLHDEEQIPQELQSKYLGIALDKAERLEELINEFFDITRFNLTAIHLEKERVHLSRMLEQIANEFLPILSERGLQWELEIEPDIEFVCDIDKLERVFDNLIRNAVYYSYPNTAIRMELYLEQQWIVFKVQNRGKTIPQEKLEHIFEQFFRLDTSRSSNTGGAGLGLAIAKEIVELHEGTITAKSREESIEFCVRFRQNATAS